MSQFLRLTCVLVISFLLCSVQAFNPRGFTARRITTSLQAADGAISAAMVGQLRAKTDAPMMECKKALIESNGDMARAEEILRVKLGNKATKVGNRIAAEGLVIAKIEGNKGVLFEANCETDFVSKNPDFVAFTKAVTDKILNDAPADIASLNAMPMGEKTVEGTRSDLVGKIGENMSLRRFKRFDNPTSQLASYVHGNRIGVIVEYEGDEEAAKDVAMHIAAQKPLCMTPDQVPPENAAKERKIAAEKAAESGKPKEIIEKMIEGSVQKYLKEVSLMNQPFVKNDKLTVSEMLKQKKTVLKSFELYVVGEGLEKKQDNFVAEVQAAQAKVQAAAAAAASGAK